MHSTLAVTLLKSALASSTKASLQGKGKCEIMFLVTVATEERKWANAVCHLPANKEGASSVHRKQAKPLTTDT